MRKKIVNVLECGADPSGTADCTAAFKEAIESGASGILVPAGTYKLSGMVKGEAPTLPAAPASEAPAAAAAPAPEE